MAVLKKIEVGAKKIGEHAINYGENIKKFWMC